MLVQGPYSRAECLTALRLYATQRSAIPTRSGYSTWCVGKSVPSANVLVRTFSPQQSCWEEVLAAAGYKAEESAIQRSRQASSYDRAQCREALQRCCSSLGRSPLQTEYDQWRRSDPAAPSALTIVRLGDPEFPVRQRWKQALATFGVPLADLPKRPKPRPGVFREKEQLICILRDCADALDEVPSSYAYDAWREEMIATGEMPPTQTTLRRRLAAESQTWANALVSAGLDPQLISSKTKAQRQHEQVTHCKDSLAAFADHFCGMPPLSMYLRWSMLDDDRASVGSILYWLAPQCRSWEVALAEAGLQTLPRLTSEEAMSRNGALPNIALAQQCEAALRDYAAIKRLRPSFLGYRTWHRENPAMPSPSEILYRLSPERWLWGLAVDRALGVTEK